MTTYSKLCPKCQRPCDLFATGCKHCGLQFGGTAKSAAANKPEKTAFSGRAALVLGALAVLLIIVAFQIVGAAQERARRMKEIESESYENVMRRLNGGQK